MVTWTLLRGSPSPRSGARCMSCPISMIGAPGGGLRRWIKGSRTAPWIDSDGNMFVEDEQAERMWLPQEHAATARRLRRSMPAREEYLCDREHEPHQRLGGRC